MSLLLAIDQGTTSSRTMIFSPDGHPVAQAQEEFPQHYPANGWVEHDPEDIWRTVIETARMAVNRLGARASEVISIGITNQRETVILWDRRSGKPIYNAIVWQDRRTADICADLKEKGHEDLIRDRTGLLLDPYFSATKIAWILDRVEGARARAEAGELCFGTVDTFLLWRLTGGAVHATDITNASRTSLFDIHRQEWDDELLEYFRVPAKILPSVHDCAADFGRVAPGLLPGTDDLPIGGIAGDQQAALIGQACLDPGAIKSTYGTGCFVIVNTGEKPVPSTHRLLTTIGYRVGGRTAYAIEGAIFVAGAAVQWLRDELRMIGSAAETEALARGLPDNGGVYLVPAFTGLGAPHWDPDARGALYGLTRSTGRAHIARATLESVIYQTSDLLDALKADGVTPKVLRVDGGMVLNDWAMQFLADISELTVARPKVMETTALGAAILAGVQQGLYPSLEDAGSNWRQDRQFTPAMARTQRDAMLSGWQQAVRRTLCV